MYKPVVKFIELILIVLVPLPFRLPGSKPAPVIRVRFIRCELRESIDAAFKRNRRGSEKLFIGIGNIVLFFHGCDELFRRQESFQGDFRIDKHQIPEFFFKRRAERTLQQSQRPFLHILFEFRHGSIPEVLLGRVEFISCIYGVPDRNEYGKRLHLSVEPVFLKESLSCLLIVLRGTQRSGEASHPVFQLIQIRPFIAHFRKLHFLFPFWSFPGAILAYLLTVFNAQAEA